jgi:hypothetical protein
MDDNHAAARQTYKAVGFERSLSWTVFYKLLQGKWENEENEDGRKWPQVRDQVKSAISVRNQVTPKLPNREFKRPIMDVPDRLDQNNE